MYACNVAQRSVAQQNVCMHACMDVCVRVCVCVVTVMFGAKRLSSEPNVQFGNYDSETKHLLCLSV